jgi:AraC-like DNA-binding protein
MILADHAPPPPRRECVARHGTRAGGMHARALCAPLRRRPGDLAGGAGYVDQAHFGHEFRAFTGLTPTRYVDVRRRFLREHPGHALDGWPLPAD